MRNLITKEPKWPIQDSDRGIIFVKLETFKRIKAVMKERSRMTDGTKFIITNKIQEKKRWL